MKIFISLTCAAFITGVLLTGCGQNQHAGKIKQVDSLITEVNNIEQRLVAVDTAELFAIKNAQVKNINFIQQSMDTIDRETAFLLDRYTLYKKAYTKWGNKIPAFYGEIKLRKQQLQELKSDMEKDLITPEQAENYYSLEALHVAELQGIVTQLDSGLSAIRPDLELTEVKIQHLMDSLKSKSAI